MNLCMESVQGRPHPNSIMIHTFITADDPQEVERGRSLLILLLSVNIKMVNLRFKTLD